MPDFILIKPQHLRFYRLINYPQTGKFEHTFTKAGHTGQANMKDVKISLLQVDTQHAGQN
jgi:hypothetical protein